MHVIVGNGNATIVANDIYNIFGCLFYLLT